MGGKDSPRSDTAILLISCPDRQGIIASVTRYIHENKGNVVDLEQHVDPGEKFFFMRIEWELGGFAMSLEAFREEFQKAIGEPFGMGWKLHSTAETQRMAVFASTSSHCLHDILSRYQAGEWKVEIPLIVSNHETLEGAAAAACVDFRHFPVTAETKRAQERRQIALLKERRIDLVVLARYMQVLSDDFVNEFPERIINIHHSFLPAFPGAKPYHSAYERGVKIIGATSHYVTADLDAGPIIEQDVARVSHVDSVEDMMRKGRDLEKVVLSRAIWSHLNRKTLVFRNRTIVFV